jgi:hypothetical protein
MIAELSRPVRLLARLLPAADRDAIVGDLLEDAAYHDICGARRDLWLASECGTIAAGLTVTRLRAWVVVPPARELAAGLALDGSRAWRSDHSGTLLRAVIFCGSLATIVFGVALLVASLMSASGY